MISLWRAATKLQYSPPNFHTWIIGQYFPNPTFMIWKRWIIGSKLEWRVIPKQCNICPMKIKVSPSYWRLQTKTKISLCGIRKFKCDVICYFHHTYEPKYSESPAKVDISRLLLSNQWKVNLCRGGINGSFDVKTQVLMNNRVWGEQWNFVGKEQFSAWSFLLFVALRPSIWLPEKKI